MAEEALDGRLPRSDTKRQTTLGYMNKAASKRFRLGLEWKCE
jgi:hypothetical protein